jgi:hypothetical protein
MTDTTDRPGIAQPPKNWRDIGTINGRRFRRLGDLETFEKARVVRTAAK